MRQCATHVSIADQFVNLSFCILHCMWPRSRRHLPTSMTLPIFSSSEFVHRIQKKKSLVHLIVLEMMAPGTSNKISIAIHDKHTIALMKPLLGNTFLFHSDSILESILMHGMSTLMYTHHLWCLKLKAFESWLLYISCLSESVYKTF